MRKQVKKLSLNKETLKSLTGDELREIAGGSFRNCLPPPIALNNIRPQITSNGDVVGLCGIK